MRLPTPRAQVGCWRAHSIPGLLTFSISLVIHSKQQPYAASLRLPCRHTEQPQGAPCFGNTPSVCATYNVTVRNSMSHLQRFEIPSR